MSIDILSLVRQLSEENEPEIQLQEEERLEKEKNDDIINYLNSKINHANTLFDENDFELFNLMLSNGKTLEDVLNFKDFSAEDSEGKVVFSNMRIDRKFEEELVLFRNARRVIDNSRATEEKIKRELISFSTYTPSSEHGKINEEVFI